MKWQWWVFAVLGGVSTVATIAFVSQAKYAALGRQVQRNVLRFLMDHGAKTTSGVISGGIVKVPMKTTAAVNATVAGMLNKFADQMGVGQTEEGDQEDEIPAPKKRSAAARGPSPAPAKASPRRAAAAATDDSDMTISDKMDDGGGFSKEGGSGRTRKDPTSCSTGDYDPDEFKPDTSRKPADDVDLFNV